MPRFHTGQGERYYDEESKFNLCLEAYEASGDLRADALDHLVEILDDGGTADLPDELKAAVDDWYRDLPMCRTVVRDRLDGGDE